MAFTKQTKLKSNNVGSIWSGDAAERMRPGAMRRDEGYGVCIDDVTRLVCIFASQKYELALYPLSDGAGDEARLHFCFAKIMVRLGPALAANSPPDCWNLFSSRRHRIIKTKDHPNGWSLLLWSG